jgi:hypothetical protein
MLLDGLAFDALDSRDADQVVGQFELAGLNSYYASLGAAIAV